MTTQLFPYANIVAGILIFIVGSMIHWVGQIISLINWDFAARIGIAEKNMITLNVTIIVSLSSFIRRSPHCLLAWATTLSLMTDQQYKHHRELSSIAL